MTLFDVTPILIIIKMLPLRVIRYIDIEAAIFRYAPLRHAIFRRALFRCYLSVDATCQMP